VRRTRRVKIVATLGPASSTSEQIERLFVAGADVFRINMSHASHDLLRRYREIIRAIEQAQKRPIGILVDLQGPKLRIGNFGEEQVTISHGDIFVLDDDPAPGTTARVHLPHREIFASVKPGDAILLNDGRVRVQVLEVTSSKIITKVIYGGILSSRKGLNLPDTVVAMPALTPKDRGDLELAASIGVDWIALSFVQRPDDVAEARKLIRGRAGVMAKIEKPSALVQLDQILELSDGIMIARGDLGVELPIELVPGRQKQITRAARQTGRPVIVATQMLESMIHDPVPTRAEVSDVATAVFEGADAVMLSAESAAGKWPEKAVAMMDQIARAVERDPHFRGIIHAQRTDPELTASDAISAAARSVAETLKLAAIVCYTSSGSTGLRAARERPDVPIIALTPSPETSRRLALVWGLHCVLTEDASDLDDMVSKACRIAMEESFADPGQRIIITAGVPLRTPGTTNLLRIAYVGEGTAGAR
jgi:pyruvate kinase